MVLGGYGVTGSRIAELLLRETNARVVIAGRRLVEAKRLADRLGRGLVGERVSAALADATDAKLLERALRDVDLVVVASSTSAEVRTVVQAAIEAGTDYFDIQGSAKKVRFLESVADIIEQNGRCFITDGGLHPGLPGALVRFAAGFMDRTQRANVASLIHLDWQDLELSRSTTTEFAAELSAYLPKKFQQGQWVQSWRDSREYAFGAPFGKRTVRPMFLEELRPLPQRYPSLTETGYYVGGFNWFVDNVVVPLGWIGLRVAGDRAAGPTGRLLAWGLRRFSRPPFGTVFLIEATGWKRGRLVSVRGSVTHDDAYTLTAIPVVACLQQYLDGSIRKPGLWYQAMAVDPRRFLTDIERLGAKVEYDLDVET
jgi:saccharopine dehydrogenase (NAD+, L-lysine-forming)